MSDAGVREARRALARLRRAVEKADRELASVVGTLRHAEGPEFPEREFDEGAGHLHSVLSFVDEQAERLAEKVLHAGGLEPGRVRRSGGV